jgi:hypothetical protein
MGKRARQRRSEEKKAATDLGFSFEKLARVVGRTVEQVKKDETKAFARRWWVAHNEWAA